jgi:prolyl oligopeptidase
MKATNGFFSNARLSTLSLCTSIMIMGTTAEAQERGSLAGHYPPTKKTDHTDEYFGKKVVDPYRWLENDMSEETKNWVVEQNNFTNIYLKQIPYRDKIKGRLATLWNYVKYSAPFKEGGVTYFSKNDGLQNQSVLYQAGSRTTSRCVFRPQYIFGGRHQLVTGNRVLKGWFFGCIPGERGWIGLA